MCALFCVTVAGWLGCREYVLYFTSGPDGPGGSTPMDGGGHCDCSSDASTNRTCPLQCEAEVGCFAGTHDGRLLEYYSATVQCLASIE
jgi:hypothetical protein